VLLISRGWLLFAAELGTKQPIALKAPIAKGAKLVEFAEITTKLVGFASSAAVTVAVIADLGRLLGHVARYY
jgi:mevalonate kinase